MPELPRTIELTDPRALRAVAHPVRLALIGALRREGPLTATRAGELIGESPTTCSFHLRQLAKYGLVEEAGGGRGRERPWQATAWFTSWPGAASDPQLAAAVELLNSVVAERYFERVLRWLGRRAEDSPEWQDAAHFGDNAGYFTAAELVKLGQRIDELLEPFGERLRRPELRPPDARFVNFIRLAFPDEQEPKEP
jgi:DNA-binding transcriptional ArsR family regulator